MCVRRSSGVLVSLHSVLLSTYVANAAVLVNRAANFLPECVGVEKATRAYGSVESIRASIEESTCDAREVGAAEDEEAAAAAEDELEDFEANRY